MFSTQDTDAINLVTDLGPTVLKTLGGLGLLLVGGRVVLRRVFEVNEWPFFCLYEENPVMSQLSI